MEWAGEVEECVARGMNCRRRLDELAQTSLAIEFLTLIRLSLPTIFLVTLAMTLPRVCKQCDAIAVEQ
jgi:hypothetical protein